MLILSVRPGQNEIRRSSTDSSVTIPFERTFRDLRGKPDEGTAEGEAFNYCGCGWPQHMLVPKGLPEALECDLFVMVSNYEQDRVGCFFYSKI
jgi:tyrosinase